MPAKIENREINGHTYTVTQLPPSKALPLKFKIVGALGESVIELAAAYQSNKDKEQAQLEAFGKALEKLFDKVTPDQLMELIRSTLNGVRRGEKDFINNSTFDSFFIDDLSEIYLVFLFVLQVNFGDFIKGLGATGLFTKAKAEVPTAVDSNK
tara:strand:+ start:1226 stop:1684 length:459 start_codon:yes stop_codon:yes gene_type:complete